MSNRQTKVEFTNLEKVMYPSLKVTKKQVIDYYIRVARRILPALEDRPLVLTRYPEGVGKEGFYEKNAPEGTPPWVKTFMHYSEGSKRKIEYILCNDIDTLIWLANLASLEIHMPLSRTQSLDEPDLVLFDIDPEPPAGTKELVATTKLLKQKLEDLGLKTYIKTSGKKGVHVVAPIDPGNTFENSRKFAHEVGKSLTKENRKIVSELSQSRDAGTVFIDYTENASGKTMVCPYSLRATNQATVSMPLDWSGLDKDLDPKDFTILTVPRTKDDPWKRLWASPDKSRG